MDLKDVRRARLAQLAKLKHVEDDPSGLATLIKKKPNQVYNLLHGHASFGEKVARSIEEAAKLPTLWLDVDKAAGDRLPGWPFDAALLDRIVALDERARAVVQGRLEEAVASRESSRPTHSDELSDLPLQDAEVARTNADPALKVRPNLDRATKRGSSERREVGKVQKPRAGRGSKGPPRRG